MRYCFDNIVENVLPLRSATPVARLFLIGALALLVWASESDSALAGFITIPGESSADFGPHVTWTMSGNTVSMSGKLDDSPVEGDFRFDSTLNASMSGGDSAGGSVFFLNETFDPFTHGGLDQIDYFIEQDSTRGTTTNEFFLALMIRQDGNLYRANPDSPTNRGHRDQLNDGLFTDFSRMDLTASDFFRYDEATHTYDEFDNPDFSTNGSLIEFGLSAFFSTGAGVHTRSQEIQNFSLVLTTSQVSAVPEASSFASLLTATLVLGGIQMLRRRQGQVLAG